jgi:gliding motility-associated-like protein
MKLKGGFFICFVALVYVNAKAQLNIVDNGGFELYTNCPSGYSTFVPQLPYAYGWMQPTSGTTDYFNACAPDNNDADVPKNYFGTQTAHGGTAYAGFLAFIDQNAFELSREYIQTQTTRALKKDRVYYLEMYVSLSDRPTYRYTVNNIGAYVSTNQIKRADADAFQFTPQVQSSTFLEDCEDWMKISGTFVANGGERYVTIGRFGPNNPANISHLSGESGNIFSYYYIDDVKLIDSCAEMDDLTTGILGKDSDYCSNRPILKTLNAANSKTLSYLWSTGATTSAITITTPGTYWVRLKNGNCVNYDSVEISNTPKPNIWLGKDTAICFNLPVKLAPKTTSPSYNYKWFTESNGGYQQVSANSFYYINYASKAVLEVTYGVCVNRDTIQVSKSYMDSLVLIRDTIVCRQTSILLDATTPGAKKYMWNTLANTAKITSKPNQNQTFWAQITDDLCVSRDSVKISILGSLPMPTDTSYCKGTSLTLNADLASSSYQWNTGETTASITVANEGMYTLTQLKSGCIVKDTIFVYEDSIPQIDLGIDTTICEGSMMNVIAWSPFGLKYRWNTGDTDQFIVVTTPGKYEVQISNASCSFTDSITISSQPRHPFSLGSDSSYCFNIPVSLAGPSSVDSYFWNNNTTDSLLSAAKPGKYWLKTVKGVCIDSDTIILSQIALPVVNIGNDTTVCEGKSVRLNAQNIGSVFEWSTGATNQSIAIRDSNTYWVKVTGASGCWTIDSLHLTNYPLPVLLANELEVLCKDSEHIVSADPDMKSYLWQDGSTHASLKVKAPGTYYMKATDKFGCNHIDSVKVIEKPRPEILTQTFYEICEPDFYIETGTTYTSYLWEDGSTLPNRHVRDYGIYGLTVTDSNECTNAAMIEVKRLCVPAVEVPNVFSPNGDGINDVIIPTYKYILETDLSIYNRWGQLLFQTNDITKSWDGASPNGGGEPGVYYFVLKCTGNEYQKFEKTGTITLIR